MEHAFYRLLPRNGAIAILVQDNNGSTLPSRQVKMQHTSCARIAVDRVIEDVLVHAAHSFAQCQQIRDVASWRDGVLILRSAGIRLHGDLLGAWSLEESTTLLTVLAIRLAAVGIHTALNFTDIRSYGRAYGRHCRAGSFW